MTLSEQRENLLTRMIRIYGFENEIVIDFCNLLESDEFTDGMLELLVVSHEISPCYSN